jgi:hypothetical protein
MDGLAQATARVYTAFRCPKVRTMPVDESLSVLSYTCGPSRPLLEMTIGDLLRRTADRFGDRLAVASCHQSRRCTWAELSDQADRVARGLACGPPTALSGS